MGDAAEMSTGLHSSIVDRIMLVSAHWQLTGLIGPKGGMMKRAAMVVLGVALSASGLLMVVQPAPADPIGKASQVCYAFKKTPYVSECKVGVHMSGNSIDMRMDVGGAKARKLCPMIVKKIDSVTGGFAAADRKWTLRIFSPYTGSHPLATCPLS